MFGKGKPTWRAALAAVAGTGVAALAVTTVAGPARAAGDARLTALFQLLDTDRSGGISVTEFQSTASVAPPFGAIAILVDTRSRRTTENRGELFARLDANNDGDLAFRELAKEALVRTVASDSVAEADANRDTRFSAAELAAYVTARKAAAAAVSDPAAGSGAFADSLVAEHDHDGDGVLTMAELRQP